MTARKLCFVTQWYPPEPVDIPQGIAQALQAEGFGIEVLTGIPNYPSGTVVAGYRAGRTMTEEVAGIRVRRAPLYPSHDSSAVKRLLNYASWALSAAVFGQRQLRRADVALVYSSPATAALPAMVARTLWRTPYVLLVQDVWPDSIFASGFLNGRAARLIRSLVDVFVRRTYARAAHVVVISPGMADLLSDRGVPRDKLSVVHNWLPESETSAPLDTGGASLRDLVGIPGTERVFLYAGNHGHAQALETVVDAFASDQARGGHLVLMGDGVTKADLQRRAAGSPRVHFLPPVDRAEAARLTRTADVHVVSLADEPLFAVTMPSKVQSGLAAGLPMLVVAAGDAARVVTGAGAGVAAAPGDTEGTARAVAALLRVDAAELVAMGARGRAAYHQDMARDVGAPRLAALLRAAANRRSA